MDDDTQAREDWEAIGEGQRALLVAVSLNPTLGVPPSVWHVAHRLVAKRLLSPHPRGFGWRTMPKGQRCAAYGRSLEEKR